MSQEYAMGWRRAALWASRDDLIADIESPAYERDMAADLATLRQQAFSQFANPEALADWLDALHECHADGSVGNRKWAAAQVAARAIRSLNEPSGNSGQLRQQAGSVGEVCKGCNGHGEVGGLTPQGYDGEECPFCHGTGKEAALAQNTQGEEPALRVPEKAWTVEFRDITGALCRGDSTLDARPIRGCALYLHAERARVPGEVDAFDKAVADELPRVSHVEFDSHEICKHFAGKVRERMLAGAPSQRAEVK